MLHLVGDELNLISDQQIKDFTVEAVNHIGPYIFPEKIAQHSKLVTKFARIICDTLEVDDIVYDIITSASLLHDICKYDYEGEENPLHPFVVRRELLGLQKIVGREMFNNIMTCIESHEGYNSPIPQVIPRLDDTVLMWVLPIANQLANKMGDKLI